MRIIHTSDWHLGQHFYTKSRAVEHRAFLAWLIEQIEQHQVDVLIVAGDIFDSGSPPSYARELYNRFVVELQSTGCQLIILAGNHDSVATLNESRELLSCLNTQVVADTQSDPEGAIIQLMDRQGQLAALLCAIPFIRPRDVLISQAGQSASDKQNALMQGIADYYMQCYQRADQLRQSLQRQIPIIASGHLTTVGVTTSESERDIYIGTLDAFPAQHFPPADYIALGHIHRGQKVANSEHIRYSGSPIPLSFDEVGKTKSVLLVEFAGASLSQITPLEIPVFQPMALIKGDMQQIESALSEYQHQSTEQPVWLDIEVVSAEYLGDIQRQIQRLTADLPVDVVLLRRSKEQRQNIIERQARETLAELTVDEVFARRMAQEEICGEEQQQRLVGLFQQVVAEVADPAANGVSHENS